MRTLYKKLYEDCCSLPGFSQSSYFAGIQGTPVDEKMRFMLVGRACNGWDDDSLRNLDAENFGIMAEEEWNDKSRWDWIREYAGALYSGHSDPPVYCVSQKPFWDYSKGIWEVLSGRKAEGVWMRQIAWTNLYKISPAKEGNPDNQYLHAEKRACIDILRKEIELYRPTHILFMTGWDWLNGFTDLFQETAYFGRNCLRGNNRNSIYVEGTARIGNAKAVVMCRPEYRDKEKYIQDAVKAFTDQ